MYLLTLKGKGDEGAYAVANKYGEKVLFLFQKEDDAALEMELIASILENSTS